MEPKFSALTTDDAEHLERQRAWARDHFDDAARWKYEDVNEKLRLISTILREKWVEPAETWKLQSLGVAFGDALAQRLDLDWMIVDDDYGRAPTLKDPHLNINLNPLTMIQKRVERGEAPDIWRIFDELCDKVAEWRERWTPQG